MNIILIGMPGCGKSTVGVLLAKTLLMDFCDTDLIIQKEYGRALCDIIAQNGADKFKNIEDEILSSLKFENTVVATGGSAVYGDAAMNNLGKGSKTVYLKLTPAEIKNRIDNITTRGIVMSSDATIEDLYNERKPLYEKYADITINCQGLTAEECVTKITEAVK